MRFNPPTMAPGGVGPVEAMPLGLDLVSFLPDLGVPAAESGDLRLRRQGQGGLDPDFARSMCL